MKKKRILIVEDEADMVEMLKTWLKAHDYNCVSAMTVEEGIEKAAALKPNLILLDVMLPQGSGLEFLKRRKESDYLQRIPVIMLSVLSDEATVSESLKLGANGYLNKLCDTHEILFAVNEYI